MIIRNEQIYADALRRICDRTDLLFYTKSWLGVNVFVNPWFDYDSMVRCIDHCESPVRTALRLLVLGESVDAGELEQEIDPEDIRLMVESGIWYRSEGKIETHNLVVLGYQGLLLLTEINPWFPTCTNPNTDVYIGNDSLRLAENISFRKGAAVLDLCSGTGIQGILAARSAKKVVSVELNPEAVTVTLFNIRLNGVEDVVELRQGDLYGVLREGESFDCIYANPPFIPMIDEVKYPICGAGGEDGLMVLNRIVDGAPAILNPHGEIVLFCECLGDAKGVFFNERLKKLGRENGWSTVLLMVSRLETGNQIKRVSDLTRLFNPDGFDEEGFRTKLEAIYQRLGATYLYHLVYHIRCDGTGDGSVRQIAQYNPWDMGNRAEVYAETGPNTVSKGLWKDGKQIGACNGETEMILNQLRSGKTVRETAETLWPEVGGKKKYAVGGFPAFLDAVLSAACRLENMGALKMIPMNDTERR